MTIGRNFLSQASSFGTGRAVTADRVALVRRAEFVGIKTPCTDALGQTREASDEALLALIDALGRPIEPAHACRI
jgi:hypothetical protein